MTIGRTGNRSRLGEGFVLRSGGRPPSSPDQVHRISDDYYSVDGYVRRIPVGQALPSQDGDYWIFYRDDGANGQSGIYCFFVPMAF